LLKAAGEKMTFKWKQYLKPIIFLFIGIIFGFPIFSMTYYTMIRTSTPQFCASCHEIQWAYNTWKTSSHRNNPKGIVADCMDCHLPAPHDTFNFFYAKTMHGIKDIVVHFFQDHYDHSKNRKAAYASIKNEQCLKCHRNLLNIPYKRGAMLAHKNVLYSDTAENKRCVDCHKNLVHNQSDIYQYKQIKPPYRGLGP